MAASESEEYRECAQFENAVEVVAGLAWQYFKKDWDRVRRVPGCLQWLRKAECLAGCLRCPVFLQHVQPAAARPLGSSCGRGPPHLHRTHTHTRAIATASAVLPGVHAGVERPP
jgi:hypothetical protein